MTCPECRAMNSKFLGFADSGNLRIVGFKCPDCGCVYSVKTQTEVMADELEIFLSDLMPAAQKKVLAFLGIKTPEESNLDVFPLFVLPKPETQ